jgi:cytochrome c oxidase assembly protein subunit 15
MGHPRLSPSRYRAITVTALAAQFVIVVTGAAVRLSDSGLGCSDWPNCNRQKLVDVTTGHAAIEQVNRLFTGVVMVAVVLAVLGALWRAPRRRDLTRLSIVIALGVPTQGLVGAIVVWTHLNPFATQQHMLVSMTLVGLSTVLVVRAGRPDDAVVVPALSGTIRNHVRAIVAVTALAIVTGTVVTGAGPHAGDERAKRFDIAIEHAARVHGITVMTAVALAVALGWRLRERHAERQVLESAMTTWLCVAVMQAGIGYIQYFNGVPPVLVGMHVAGATGLWLATVHLWLVTARVDSPAPEAATVLAGTAPVFGAPRQSSSAPA